MIDYYKELESSTNTGSSIVEGIDKRIEERARLRKDDVLFKDWLVKVNGDMININQYDYCIDEPRLEQEDWISHIKQKGWDMNTFLDAYWFALQVRKGVSHMKIRIY